MMGFVIVTAEDHAIVIDGGRPEDMPLLKKLVGGRHISAWILTHAHNDHISGFVDEWKKNGAADFDIERVYYHFPPYRELISRADEAPNPAYFKRELNEMLPAFLEIEPMLGDRAVIVSKGDTVTLDECRIEFLFSYRDGLFGNLMNDASLVFRISTPHKSVIFLGDLGPEAGDLLLLEQCGRLSADIVQVAHHGHMGVGPEIYIEIMPKACLWCAPDWLYEEQEILYNGHSGFFERRAKGRSRLYGTKMTRKWLDAIGVREHYVSKDGTQAIEL